MPVRLRLALLILLVLSFAPHGARAQTGQCSLSLTAADRDRNPEVVAAALRTCRLHWEGTLAVTGTQASVKVQTGLDVPDGILGELVSALQRADRAAAELPRIQGTDRLELFAFGPGAAPAELEATATAVTFATEANCHILFLPTSWSDPAMRPYLDFTIAHEFFHCLQAASVPELRRQNPEWVIEVTAEWFAHFAVPGMPLGWVNEFENHVSRRPIYENDWTTRTVRGYRNWVIFAWYSRYRGPEFVVNTLLNLTPDADNAEAVLSMFDQELWTEFAYWYNADLVRSPDGRPLVPTTEYETGLHVVPDGATEDTVTPPRQAAAMLRHRIELGAGYWELTVPRGTEAILLELDEAGQPTGGADRLDWTGATAEVDCGNRGAILVAQVAESDDPLEISIRHLEDTCASACDEVPRRADQCLVGSWEVLGADANFENSAFIGMARLMALFGGGSLDVVDIHSETFCFAPDGTFTSNRPMTFAGRTPEARMRMEVLRNTDTGRWGVNGGHLTVCTNRNEFEALSQAQPKTAAAARPSGQTSASRMNPRHRPGTRARATH
ncbi:MAG: hypothetical protein ACU0GG_02135 [Paracoccaceae bacterium]